MHVTELQGRWNELPKGVTKNMTINEWAKVLDLA